jgi:hypothetical protein
MRTYEKRGRLQSNIWEYKRRMDGGEQKPGRIMDMQEMIKKWEKMMEDIDRENNLIRALGNAVAYRTGYNVKKNYHNKLPGMKQALGLFYKYGLDNGITGKRLLEYTGASGSNIPGKFRSWMVSTEENLNVYHGFKRYMEELLKDIENSSDNQ